MKEYQRRLAKYLKAIFGEHEIKTEWDVSKHSEDNLIKELYCPRIDIAIGPFNITRYIWRNLTNINEAYDRARTFSDELEIIANQQIEDINFNENPRCLMAVEIEKSGSRKHMLGDIVNACSIGKLGIIVAWDQNALNAFLRIKKYLDFITEAKKVVYSPKNLIIVSKEGFEELAQEFSRRILKD